MFGINILGTGSYNPAVVVDNEMMSTIVETNDEWITTRTGIKTRNMVKDEPCFEMGAKAAQKAIEAAGIDVLEIGLIIDTTIGNDFSTPAVACIIQDKIGAKNAVAFDINAACSGFAYGVDMARRYLQTDENLKYVLVISNEILSRIVDYTDRATCILFGDGAGAILLERSEKMFTSHLETDGSGAKLLYAKKHSQIHPFGAIDTNYGEEFSAENEFIAQDGREVYKFATKALPRATEKAAEKIGFDVNEIDWFIPHQANVRIIETAAKNLGVSMEKFIVNLPNHGNTSSASIPIAFDEAVRDGRIKKGDKICFVGFGAGLTAAAIILEY